MGVSGTVFLIVAFVALALNLSGCAQPIGATRFPEASATFVPRKEYAVPFEGVWNVVHKVLENNRIAVAAASRDEGRITTEYVQGQSQMYALGFGGTLSTRYKYAIRLSPVSTASTTINILAYLESSSSAGPPEGGAVGGAWRDISNDNKLIVANQTKLVSSSLPSTNALHRSAPIVAPSELEGGVITGGRASDKMFRWEHTASYFGASLKAARTPI